MTSTTRKKYWSADATRRSNALDLEPSVFTFSHPDRIARSLRRSAERSTRRKSDSYRSAMSGITGLFIVIAAAPAYPQRPAAVVLRPGLVITRSVTAVARVYRFESSSETPVIVIRGNDITVDLGGATIEGSAPNADPDRAHGTAILIDGGHNVRVLHARIRGFRTAVLARGTSHLELTGIDASYNWKPRLFSLVEHESLADWLSYHHNEKDEWLRFGAGFYLSDVKGGRVSGNTVEQGMNGLLLVRSDSLVVSDNDFSFNSGVGIGLYRSNDNMILHNRLDYNVRGYSEGFYHRGQDSADLLMYEQSSGNRVAFNSATHGGDGLFLWAGQHTMDTGLGGANDNAFYMNDFSYAPANAMEATFSRNDFVGNIANGSDYGLWGGYSYGSEVFGNCFVKDRIGVAIEHGQGNAITHNQFYGDSVAVRLWADRVDPNDSGYPRHHDTRSRGYQIRDNVLAGNRIGIVASNTSGLTQARNDSSVREPAACRPPVREFAGFSRYEPHVAGVENAIPVTEASRRTRSAIVVDEWGPFDWRSPRLWPVDSVHDRPLRLAVLGPPGAWRVVSRRGIASLSRTAGAVGDTIAVLSRPDSSGDWRLELEYRGLPTVSPRGSARPARTPYRFEYGHFEPTTSWDVRFFVWNDQSDPRTKPAAFTALLRSSPLITARVPRLDYLWYRPMVGGLPQSHWGLDASAAVDLPAGEYTLQTISDDGVRVWVDGALVIDDWSLHESTVDQATLRGGHHVMRLQYFQVDGWTELRFDILRGRIRSTGSPGLH